MNATLRLLLALLVVGGYTQSGLAQVNVAVNGSFEEASKCPDSEGDLQYVDGFYNYYFRTSDFFSGCGEPRFGVPNNGPGSQQPYDGFSYAGIIASTENYYWFDYIIGTLDTSNMIDGEEYCINIQVSLAENSPYAINELGIFFSPHKEVITIYRPDGRIWYYRLPSSERIDSIGYVTPQAQFEHNNDFLDNTTSWMELKTRLTYTKNVDAHFWIGVLPGNTLERKKMNDNQRVFNPDNTTYYFVDDIKIFQVRNDTLAVTPELEYACDQPTYKIKNQHPGYTIKVRNKESLLLETTKDLSFSTTVDFDSLTIEAVSPGGCHTIRYIVDDQLSPITNRNFNLLYPNPTTTGLATLNILNTQANARAYYELYDYLGKLVKKHEVPLSVGLNTLEFDVSDLESGIYHIDVKTPSCSKVYSLVVKN